MDIKTKLRNHNVPKRQNNHNVPKRQNNNNNITNKPTPRSADLLVDATESSVNTINGPLEVAISIEGKKKAV